MTWLKQNNKEQYDKMDQINNSEEYIIMTQILNLIIISKTKTKRYEYNPKQYWTTNDIMKYEQNVYNEENAKN